MEHKNLLEKGIEVLEVLKDTEASLSFVQIQKKLSIPKTTLYRVLNSLVEKNLVFCQDKRYKLGYGILPFAKKVLSEIPLRELVSPYLKKLCGYTGETIELIIPDRDTILYIDKVESPQSIKLVAQIGSRYTTLHASAPGKILLAYNEDAFKKFIKNKKFKKITSKTIVDKKAFGEEIEKIKKSGWAYDIGEARIDVIRIAAPVFNYEGKLTGIISIAGPYYRIKKEKIKEFGEFLKRICEEISEKLGYTRR
ncbi:MAG: IclR family transcriptional regulator [Candidatus Omnitrophica bacterium]|nr:IclR family transcriptional regulator [Candidatus Omnitrophota bacterium]